MINKVDKKFMEYCSKHVYSLDEFKDEVTKIVNHQKTMTPINHGELWRLLKKDHQDYLRKKPHDPYNFGEFLSWQYPVSRMILESRY